MERVQKSQKTMKALNRASASNGKGLDKATLDNALDRLIETMDEDYIRTARAKGLTERRVVMRHGVRAAISPIVTILGLDIAALLGSSVLVETVFNIPGIGRLNYDAITHSDFPIVQGIVELGQSAVGPW